MKKTSLVLFPVLAALLMAGCTTAKKSGKKKKSSAASVTSQTTSQGGGGGGSSSSSGGGGGGSSSSGGGGGGAGLVATLDLKSDHATTKSDAQVVIVNGGVTLTIDQNGSQHPCGGDQQKYVADPLRIYSGQKLTFECNSAFNKVVFDSANFADNAYAEYLTAAINQGSYGTAVQADTTVTVTLSSASTSWFYVDEKLNRETDGGYKQNRIYKVEFYNN